MTCVTRISAYGWPVRVMTRHRSETIAGIHSETETFDMPRWSELEVAITPTQSVQWQEMTGEEWQEKPAIPPAPTTA